MYAITVREPGGPDVLEWTKVEDPRPGPGEVLLDVAASAVNRADLLQRRGLYPPPPGASETIGLECSGTIAELGEGVEGWQVGDEVCASDLRRTPAHNPQHPTPTRAATVK